VGLEKGLSRIVSENEGRISIISHVSLWGKGGGRDIFDLEGETELSIAFWTETKSRHDLDLKESSVEDPRGLFWKSE